MFKKIVIGLSLASLAASFEACNSSTPVEGDTLADAAQITGFSLKADDKVLSNLDSVFFSIDQVTGKIFNADSLPKGTKITRLIPQITAGSASLVELTVSRAGRADTTYNYISDSNDSIDFTNPVKLRIVSADGQCSHQYEIRVNVHKVDADTLVWGRIDRASLPTSLASVKSQKTAHTGSMFYCLTTDGSRYCLANTQNPQNNEWEYSTPKFGADVDVETLGATDNALYILDKSGNLLTSVNGTEWSTTGEKWTTIIGGAQNTILGTVKSGSTWMTVSYPGGTASVAPADFPVTGTSQTVTYTFGMGVPQTMVTGGRCADGKLTGATWGFDGKVWAKISRKEIPYPMEKVTVVPYFVSNLNKNNWSVTRQTRLLAMFGTRENDVMNDTVYMSPDLGISWVKAPQSMQIHGVVESRTDAQGFVYSQTLHEKASRSAERGWTVLRETPVVRSSRAVAPITEWECPYIYVFGGKNASGETYNTVYRGVINWFTFKPLQ